MPDLAPAMPFLAIIPFGEASVLKIVLAVSGVAVISYALGSLCFAIIFTKIFTGRDIRKLGSGNAGTANVLRSAGLIPGILTGVLDFLKGTFAVYVGYYLFETAGYNSYSGGCFAAIFVLIGHLFPVFFKYRGGKGFMTMAGIILVLNWKLFLVLAVIYSSVFASVRITSVAALVTAAVLPVTNAIICIISGQPWLNPSVFFTVTSLIIFYTHRDNIRRLRAGQENRLMVKRGKKK